MSLRAELESFYAGGTISMRVVAGSAKGRKLYVPKGVDIRPTSDRVKEAIFNIIGPEVKDKNILDLFAGTGNLAIEALSRGAHRAYLVDSSPRAIDAIQKNLKVTDLQDKAVVLKADADKALKRFIKDKQEFDLIFLDPPYRISVSFLDAILLTLATGILKHEGLLVLEHSAKDKPKPVEGLEIISTRIYGDTAVTFYRKKG